MRISLRIQHWLYGGAFVLAWLGMAFSGLMFVVVMLAHPVRDSEPTMEQLRVQENFTAGVAVGLFVSFLAISMVRGWGKSLKKARSQQPMP